MTRSANEKVANAWRQVWESPEGRLALGELFLSLNLYSEAIPTDPIQAGIVIGERNVAARIARWVGRNPQDFVADAKDDVDLIDRINEERIY
jgi:predicted component of type VI protein secretion system